jgi:hypothetical protein
MGRRMPGVFRHFPFSPDCCRTIAAFSQAANSPTVGGRRREAVAGVCFREPSRPRNCSGAASESRGGWITLPRDFVPVETRWDFGFFGFGRWRVERSVRKYE